MTLTWFVLLLLSSAALGMYTGSQQGSCEPVKANLCLKLDRAGYVNTSFPNYFKMQSQERAINELELFRGLIESECAVEMPLFLCSLYIPFCMPMNLELLPCRSLCEASRAGCEWVVSNHGHKWPKTLQCSNFPDEKDNSLCINGPQREMNKRGIQVHGFKGAKRVMQCKGNKKILIKKICYEETDSETCTKNIHKSILDLCDRKKRCLLEFKEGLVGSSCYERLSKVTMKYQCVDNIPLKHKIRTCSKV